MALPKITVPEFEITLPVSKNKVTFRPFLVKEQKILLMAMESGESETIERNIKQVLNNCLITPLDIDNLPLVDIEYYFLNIRARSVGEVIESRYKCENVVDNKVCGNVMETQVNILDINISLPENINDVIKITDKIGIKMKYPNYSLISKLQKSETITDIAFELILDCIDYIYDDDNLYYANETPKHELEAFLETLTEKQFQKLEEFVDNIPKLKKQINVKCNKCGFDHKINIEGLDDFFV